jgi:hypothetical protein
VITQRDYGTASIGSVRYQAPDGDCKDSPAMSGNHCARGVNFMVAASVV